MYEFTPEQAGWKGVIYPSEASFIEYAYTVKESETPYLLVGTLKNIGTEEYDVWDIDAKIIINEQYEFDASVKIESKDGKSFEYDLKPLQERKCYIYAGIPFEVYEIFENCRIEMEFTNGKGVQENVYVISFDKEASGL